MKVPTVIHGFVPLVPGLRALCAAFVLCAPPAAASAVSYDGDGLIEINSLAQLNAIRDFDTDGDGDVDSADEYWHWGNGWEPIGSSGTGNEFAATFAGNGVANEVSEVTVTSYLSDGGATIDIDGSSISSGSGHAVPLSEGQNETTIYARRPSC